MSDSREPTVKIRIYDGYIHLICDSTGHLSNICKNFGFCDKNEVIRGHFYYIDNKNSLEGFRSYLQNKGFPYAVYKGDNKKSSHYWTPTNTCSLISTGISKKQVMVLKELGYITIEDIRRESVEHLETFNDINDNTIDVIRNKI